MPNNPMTDILREFRSYRPENHNSWLTWVDKSAQQVHLADYAEQDAQSLSLYIQLLDQVRDFRNRHWMFAKEYIIKRTNHPVATGGSPMATWLPNQLNTVLQRIQDKVQILNERFGKETDTFDNELITFINKRATGQQVGLQRDVGEFMEKFSSSKKPETVFGTVMKTLAKPFVLLKNLFKC
jgi:indoleamine 2,3-dioxygenase